MFPNHYIYTKLLATKEPIMHLDNGYTDLLTTKTSILQYYNENFNYISQTSRIPWQSNDICLFSSHFGHLDHKTPCAIIPKGSLTEQLKTKGEVANPVSRLFEPVSILWNMVTRPC